MNQKTHISRTVQAAGEKAQYDHEVKQLFRNKTILAWILCKRQILRLPINERR